MVATLGQQYNVGEKPTVLLYTTYTLIAMQGHQKNSKNKNNVVVHLSSNTVVKIYCYIIGCKNDKATSNTVCTVPVAQR